MLAQIGVRHLSDPYLLCAEQHCQVYGGLASRRPSTDVAVSVTRGEALFSSDGRLVDSVYSAVCGGHTEDNETVWGGPPDPALRGVPDLAESSRQAWTEKLSDERRLRRWLARRPASYCSLSGAARNKVRWTRRFDGAEVDRLLAFLNVGHVQRLVPRDRGSSGRAATLRVEGDQGQARAAW